MDRNLRYSNKLANKQVHPVQLADFRIAVEKILLKFLESAEETVEFPYYLNKEQRMFVHEMCHKLGLKHHDKGTGKETK